MPPQHGRPPIPSALAQALEADLHASRGSLAAAERLAALSVARLQAVPADEPGAASRIAHAVLMVALDTGNHRLAAQAAALPRGADEQARHRVHAEAAAGVAAFMAGNWSLARNHLRIAAHTCRSDEARHLAGISIGLWIELAMAMADDEAVGDGLAMIDALPMGFAGQMLDAPRIRARAWQARRAGQPGEALDLLMRLAVSPNRSRPYGVSRLDAAWLACDAGRVAEADRLICGDRGWLGGSALGCALQARRWQVEDSPERTAMAWARAKAHWRARWPSRWSAESADDSISASLPSAELRGQLRLGPPR